jgi:ribonuclease Z
MCKPRHSRGRRSGECQNPVNAIIYWILAFASKTVLVISQRLPSLFAVLILSTTTAIAHDNEDRTVSSGTPKRIFYKNYYFPNTEELGENEMRVIALGTGNPDLRKEQVASSWFVELGNGDKFFFDVGLGSQVNFPMLQVSFRDADKVFLSHLHVDHVGDLDALWLSGWVSNRYDRPLRVWGPSGAKKKYGTKHFVEKQVEAWAWDIDSRHGKLPAAGAEIEVNEFDFSKTHVVYDENDVKITSIPALHIMDGPVSYRLDWNGLSFAYSGDTTPTKFFVDATQGVDLMVHETFETAKQTVERLGWDMETSKMVTQWVHTDPREGGKVFEMTKPRMAVGYHFWNDFDLIHEVRDDIRQFYKGPLSMAEDGMVFNVTADEITVRMLVGPGHTFEEIVDSEEFGKAPRGKNIPPSDWLLKGKLFKN